MNTKNTVPSVWSKITNSITFKAVSIGILILLLLIPVTMVQELIRERRYANESVVNEVSSKWGYAQRLTGPIIMIPYKNTYWDNKVQKATQHYAYFLPEELGISAQMEPEILHRSIYNVVVYQAKIKVKGHFRQPDFSELNVNPEFIDWKNACLFIGISDMRGIRNKIAFNWNKEEKEVLPGIDGSKILNSGVTVKLPLLPEAGKDANYDFNFDLTLNGSNGLSFIPVGKTTKISAASPWSAPNFDGAFLPDNRTISMNGFTADWSIFNYNRNFPQMWVDDSPDFESSSIDVNLILPVDHYQKSTRAVKYAIIFISLTFLTFFLVELITRKRVHTMQYLLVSIGLILFYSILLALSEQMSFSWAYLISASAIVSLITAYSYSIFKQLKQTLLMGALFCVLYVFLYVVLQLEDFALLIGSIGLFIALAVIMYASRKINWFQNREPVSATLPEKENIAEEENI